MQNCIDKRGLMESARTDTVACFLSESRSRAWPPGYADADPSRYTDMVSADRNLKLAGHEAFRLGAKKLQHSSVKANAKLFFESILKRQSVKNIMHGRFE